jgi:O-antigen ligase
MEGLLFLLARIRGFFPLMERRLAGLLSAGSLVYFVVSIPEGAPGYAALVATALVAFAEYAKTGGGFCLFLFLWPAMLPVKEYCIVHFGAQWASLPEFWGWPVAAALLFALWIKDEAVSTCRSPRGDVMASSVVQVWSGIFRILFWILAFAYFVACAMAAVRLSTPPADWIVPKGAEHALWENGMAFIIPLLLGTYLLNRLSNFEGKPIGPGGVTDGLFPLPYASMIGFSLAGGVLAAALFIYQVASGVVWSFNFNAALLAGPFQNKNTTAPFFIFLALLSFAVPGAARWRRVLLIILSAVFFMLAVKTGSRNGIFMIVCVVAGSLLVRASLRKVLLVFLLLAALYWAPLTVIGNIPVKALSRSVHTLEASGGVASLVGERGNIYSAALHIFYDYPWYGSGPGTFSMLTARGARYGILDGMTYYSAHSMPFNLLAETGVMGFAAWTAAWIVVPLYAVIRWRTGNAFALIILVAGLGNLFDTVWMVPAITTFSVLLIVWACAAHGVFLSSTPMPEGAAALQEGR